MIARPTTTSKKRLKQSELRAPAPKDKAAVKRMLREGSIVDKDGCWIWQGGQRASYAYVHSAVARNDYDLPFPSEFRMLHKLATWVNHGDVAWVKFSLHKCDKHLCVRPRCMRPGNHADNMADASARGRFKANRARLFGDANPMYGKRHSPELLAKIKASNAKHDWSAIVRKAWIKRRENAKIAL